MGVILKKFSNLLLGPKKWQALCTGRCAPWKGSSANLWEGAKFSDTHVLNEVEKKISLPHQESNCGCPVSKCVAILPYVKGMTFRFIPSFCMFIQYDLIGISCVWKHISSSKLHNRLRRKLVSNKKWNHIGEYLCFVGVSVKNLICLHLQLSSHCVVPNWCTITIVLTIGQLGCPGYGNWSVSEPKLLFHQ